MTGASQGACFGRAPPSLRSPPVRSERLINLDGLTENSGHNLSGGDEKAGCMGEIGRSWLLGPG